MALNDLVPISPTETITGQGENDSPEKKGPVPWPTEDEEIILRVKECRDRSEKALSDWYTDAEIDFNFAEGKQWDDVDSSKLNREDRLACVFNRCAPVVNSILGQEVCNRQEVRYLPRKIGPVSTADTMNDAVKWVRDQCNAEDEDSDAFSDMVTCGMGWTVTRMEYEKTPEGMPDVMRRDPMLMRWDPAARQKNLADAKWIQADYWMDRDAIEDRWPDADTSSVVDLQTPDQGKQPHDSTEAWKYKTNATLGKDSYDDQLRVIHHVEHYSVTSYRMIDPMTQSPRDYSKDEYDAIKAKAKQVNVKLPPPLAIKKRVYRQAWTVGSVCLESGNQASQKDFIYQCMTCYRERETGFWYGVIRMMRDPQRYANRLMSLMMSILATGPKGGAFYETGAFANPKKAKQEWARYDSLVEIKPGMLDKIQPKTPIVMPTGAAELMQFAVASIRDVTGVNIDMLGGADRDQPGIVEDMRTKSGLTILAKVFDAIRLYRKRQGVILAEYVQRFISDGRLIKVVSSYDQQYVPLFRDPDSVEYDLVIDESPAARDVKERTWVALQAIVPLAQAAGAPMPPSLLDYAPIPQSLALEWKKAISDSMQKGPPPNPLVEAEKVKSQANQQIAQAKTQSDMQVAQARMQMETQIAQQKAAQEAQLEQIKAQKEQAVEMARAQANIQIEAETARIKEQYALELESIKSSRAQQTELAIARMRMIAEIETARIKAGMGQGAGIVDAELSAIGQPGAGDPMQHHTAMMQQLGSHMQQLNAAIKAPRRLVRGPDGRAVASVVD